ncbi:MAG TPA: DUF937 domain-containing protein [Povalibacter sp.]|nr:DUF937 domain-containing protein [Povalibacter sp.]
MQIADVLQQMGGIQSMARELGVSESQAASASAALIPAILGGFKKQAQTQSTGLDGLGGVLAQLGGGGLLEEVLAAQPTNVNRGNDVLDQIFGSKDVSRAVAQNAATQTGLDPSLLRKMLPMLAMLVGGLISKQGGGGAAPQAGAAGGLAGMLGGLLGGGGSAAPGRGAGLASMLDLDGNGNPLDDILRTLSR